MLDAQASFVTTDVTRQEASSERESLFDDNDVERNADLYFTFLIMKSLSVNFSVN